MGTGIITVHIPFSNTLWKFYIIKNILEYIMKKSTTSSVHAFGSQESLCLKGIAIVMLICHHCFLGPARYKGQAVTFIIPENIWNYVALFFKICVCIFAFISAYGITWKIKSSCHFDSAEQTQKDFRNILLSRLIRLLTSFILVFLLVDVFALFYDPGRFAEIYGTSFPVCIAYFILDMLGLAQLLHTPTFLGTYWYYSLAIVIVLLVPCFYLLIRKIGTVPFLGLIAVINFTVSIPNHNFWRYLLCIAVGVSCAYNNTIVKIMNWDIIKSQKWNHLVKFLIEFLLLFVLMVLRQGPLMDILYPFWDAVIPVVFASFCCEFIVIIPGLRQLLIFLGTYSANIFIIHNYIRKVWFYDFTYSFKYPLLIVMVLLSISLVLSICIEQLKKIIHYNSFTCLLVQKICK